MIDLTEPINVDALSSRIQEAREGQIKTVKDDPMFKDMDESIRFKIQLHISNSILSGMDATIAWVQERDKRRRNDNRTISIGKES